MTQPHHSEPGLPTHLAASTPSATTDLTALAQRPSGTLAIWLKPQDTPLPTVPNADFASAVRLGLWLLIVGFGGFLLWAALAPLDEGVPAQGVLAVDSKRKRIDHLAGGLVEKILVKEGQRVEAGDELVLLNEVQGKAALNATLSQWRIATATVARLVAERDGERKIRFPSPSLQRNVIIQQLLFVTG
jgi:protease secretion system membrane fusion protein